MALTYEFIAQLPAGNGTFTSIPQGYTHLRLVASVGQMVFNGDGGTNYSQAFMYGTGSANSGARIVNTSAGYLYYPSTPGHLTIVDIFNYSKTTGAKTFLAQTSASALDSSGWVGRSIGLWRGNAAITSIYVSNYNGPVPAKLYGIKAA